MKSDFAEILSCLRREKGLSQRRAASELGVSQALLSHYENDARIPKLEFVIKACDFYEVTADYMLGRAGGPASGASGVHGAPRSDGAARLISAVCAVLDTLEGFSDAELFGAAEDFMTIPVETVASLLSDPSLPYDPSRDAKLKMAEAALVAKTRGLCGEVLNKE